MKLQHISITTQGTPGFQTLTQSEERNFFLSLLKRVLELYRLQREGRDSPGDNQNGI